MTGRLIIEDSDIDLEPGTVVAITMQVNDVATVDDRQSNFSNSFQAPPTNRNKATLEYPEKPQTNSAIPYRKLRARYIQNGIQVIKNGFAQIDSVQENYELVLFDGNVSFFDLIEGKKLLDLDLTDLDHTWTWQHIIDRITNTDGIIYPLVDLGNAQTDLRYTYSQYMTPWIFAKTLIERIFESVGWTFSGEFLTGYIYNNLVISLPTLKQLPANLLVVAATSGTTSPPAAEFLNFDFEESDPLDQMGTESVTVNPGGTGSFWRFKAYASGLYTFSLSAPYEFTAMATGQITVYKKLVSSADLIIVSQSPVFAPFTSGIYETVIEGVDLHQNESVYVYFDVTLSSLTAEGKIFSGATFRCIDVNQSEIKYLDTFPIALNLPQLSQKDFLKSIMQMLCLIPLTNTLTQNIHFIQFSEIVANIPQARDWTSRMNMQVKPKIAFHPTTYSQVNYLRYKDDDTVTEELGDGFFAIDDGTLTQTKDLLTLPYAASDMVIRMNGLNVPQWIRVDDDGNIKEGSARIALLDRKVLGQSVNYNDGSSSYLNTDGENLVYFILSGKTYNLGFSNNLLNNYIDFAAMLNRYKKITCAMRLTASDVEEMAEMVDDKGFPIPVYMRQFSSYFYVNRISQWIDRSTDCEVELVKLANVDVLDGAEFDYGFDLSFTS